MKRANRAISRKSTVKRLLTVACAMCTLTACHEPKLVMPENEGAAHAEKYVFDIVLLSEWAGHILPANEVFPLLISKDNLYLKENFKAADDCPSGLPKPLESSISNFKIPLPDELKTQVGQQEIKFHAVKYGGENNLVTCQRLKQHALAPKSEWTCDASSENSIINSLIYHFETDSEDIGDDNPGNDPTCPEDDPNCNETPQCPEDDPNCGTKPDNDIPKDPKLFAYTCSYASGGAPTLNRMWNDKTLYGDRRVIRLANGDSFGISQKIASFFDDHLVPLFLNAIRLDFDILGNHNFDKTLEYLNSVLERSNYNYLSTNLINASKVLPKVSPYAIYEVPAEDGVSKPLRVAIIGGIDSDAIDKVYPGRFGTIAVNSFCSIVQALEKAYNQNARAFFILAHVSTNGAGLPELLNALFSFKDQNYLSECTSILEVPQERLPEAYVQKGITSLDKTDETYLKLIAQIREEIFDGIIGVMGEGSSSEYLIPFYYDKNKTSYCSNDITDNCCPLVSNGEIPLPLCNYSTADSQATPSLSFDKYFVPSNYITQHPVFEHSDYCQAPYGSKLICHSYQFEKTSDHIVYFMQFKSQSISSGHLKVEVTRQTDTPNTSSPYASPYRADIVQFDLSPVVAPESPTLTYEDPNIDGMNSVSLITPTPASCDQFFDSDDFRTTIDSNGKCHTFYTQLKQVSGSTPRRYFSINEFENIDLYYACYDELNKVAINAQGDSQTLDRLTAAWSCLYHKMNYLTCSNEGAVEDAFVDPVIFEFNPDLFIPSNSTNDRQMTTFRSNLVANGVFNYVSEMMSTPGNSTPYDLILLNTGAIRNDQQSDELNQSHTISRTWIETISPYGNVVTIMKLRAETLAKSFEQTLHKAGKGSFPATTNVVVSYTKDPSGNIQVHEIWSIDRFGALTKPLFVRFDNANNAPTCGDKCVFATYETPKANTNSLTLMLREGVLYKIDKHGNNYFECHENDCSTPITFDQMIYVDKPLDEQNHSRTFVTQSDNNGERMLNLITNEYIASGASDFTVAPNDEDKNPMTTDTSFISSDFPINDCVAQYYSSTDIGCTSEDVTYNTFDGMNADMVACMLAVNHYFEIKEDASYSRWVMHASPNQTETDYTKVIENLNLTCSAEALNTFTSGETSDDSTDSDEPVG